MYIVVVCNCCLQYLLILHLCWTYMECIMYGFVFLWNSALLVSSIGNKSVRHICKENIWKLCEISIAIDLSIFITKRRLLSQQAISLDTVMSVWVIHVWSTSGIRNMTAYSVVYLFQCFVLMWCRHQVPAEYRYYRYMVPNPSRPLCKYLMLWEHQIS